MKLLFEVKEEKIKTESGALIPDKKAIVREDTGKILGVVSNRYKLVRHQEILNSVTQVVTDLGLKEPSISLCKDGAIMFARFMGEKSWECKPGDIVQFGLQVFNSYNGYLPVGVILVAERLKCTNGLIAHETMTNFAVKHYGSLSLGEIRRKAEDVLSKADVISAKWEHWNQVQVTRDKVKELFSTVFGTRDRERMLRNYLESKEGDTVWDVYQYLTYHISHNLSARKGNEQNVPLLRWGMETNVSEKVSDFDWVT